MSTFYTMLFALAATFAILAAIRIVWIILCILWRYERSLRRVEALSELGEDQLIINETLADELAECDAIVANFWPLVGDFSVWTSRNLHA